MPRTVEFLEVHWSASVVALISKEDPSPWIDRTAPLWWGGKGGEGGQSAKLNCTQKGTKGEGTAFQIGMRWYYMSLAEALRPSA